MLEGASVSSLLVYNYIYTIGEKTMAQTSKYKRVVLKLSGEALWRNKGFGKSNHY